MVGCGDASAPWSSTRESGPPAAAEGEINSNKANVPFGDDEALSYLTRECAACHGTDESGVPAINASQWQLPAGNKPTRIWLESTTDTADVYQSLLLASQRKREGFPVAMPPAALDDDAKRVEVGRMLAWMRITQPLAVLDANETYGNAGEKTPPNVTFTCTKQATLRRFVSSFMLAAYERAPTVDEINALPAADLDQPVKPEARQAIVGQLANAGGPKNEFVAHGLKRLATAIGGAPNIAPGGPLTPEIAKELEDEFYSLLQDRWDTAKYRSLFQDNTVMATASTAPLYGCAPPAEGGPARTACTMTGPRHGFFSTLGFLNSKQSSFLVTNNNYGRVGFLYFTLFGGVPRAATSGPAGAAAAALPSCLEGSDSRSLVGAAFGTRAIPEVGAYCQGCHLYKGLAAGSVLFRPFSTRGFLYDAAEVAAGKDTPGDEAFVLKNALLADRKVDTTGDAITKVDTAFLSSLATSSLEAPLSCLPTSDPNKPFITFKHIGELTDFLLARSVSLATGFTRHAHRAFANSSTPSAEMILRVYGALNKEGTMLDLATAYFNSDSFACDGAPE
jgi:hypothetical protein